MKYKLVERKNPGKQDEPAKTYATPIWDGIIDIEQLADVIAGRSSLTKGDVLNVLQNFQDEVPRYLLMGKAVNLNKLGIFRLSFGSSGSDTAKDFNASQIRSPRIIFLASPQLKKKIANDVKFSRETPSEKSKDKEEDDRPVIQ